MAGPPTQQTFNLALQHHGCGRLAQAEQMYRQVLAEQPNHPDALHWLGVIATQTGHSDAAVDLIGRAVALRPNDALLHGDLGCALSVAGRLDQAVCAYRQAIVLNPQFAEAHFNLGNALRDQGQVDQALAAYRQAIALKPGWAEAYSNLGNALRDQGSLGEAIAAYRQAIALKPDFAEAHSNLGNALQDQGELTEAIAAYRQTLALKPHLAEAHYNLGNALRDQGELDQAVAAYRRALALKPELAKAHVNLGDVLKDQGQLAEAIAAYRQAIALKPDFAEAHLNLGTALRDQGELDQAITACRQAIALKPDLAQAHLNLGTALLDQGQVDQALAAYRRAIALQPHLAEAHYNLGTALRDQGQLDQAIAAYRRALALKPDLAEAHYNLGNAFKDQGAVDQAVLALRQAIALKPDFAEAHSNLGNALRDKRELDQAIAAYRQAIAVKPDFAGAYCNLGNTLRDQGLLDEAMTCYRQALVLDSNDAQTHSNLLYTLHLHPACAAAALAEEHRRWNQVYAQPLAHLIQPHAHPPRPDKRLRVGYLSPDLRMHPVGRFLLPLLGAHNHQLFEIFCYADVPRPDAITQRFTGLSDTWRDIVGQSDAAVAQLIRQDGIDILVDLTMHSANHRLLVFARKPAPVQVTYLAYCSTTGLHTIDYRLTDPQLDPPGLNDSYYSEQSVRLPEIYWCYEPAIATPEVNDLPALACGYLTFGCLNNFCKVTQPTLEAWAALLQAVAGSRLVLNCPPGSTRQRVGDFFTARGTPAQRIVFTDRVPLPRYFQSYQDIDIALDPFPCGGGTTTCDALWMGVPVVSLIGQLPVARSGLTLLSQVGLSHLAVTTWPEYIGAAAKLAGDLPVLRQLRSTLRERMRLSPLMDVPRFARNVEAAYRQMWRTWCQQGPPST